MTELGAVVTPGSPAEFGKFVEAETVKWTKVIKAANIQPD
jgi:tripartite-type tricarboxylate transporter receptor subunit TctC